MSVSNREEYITNDNNYSLVVEKINEVSIIPFVLDDLRFVTGKRVSDKWIYKDVFVLPFEYSIHHSMRYVISWIDGGLVIKFIGEKSEYNRTYRIYFEDIF